MWVLGGQHGLSVKLCGLCLEFSGIEMSRCAGLVELTSPLQVLVMPRPGLGRTSINCVSHW